MGEKILIIEDEEKLAEIIANFLEKEGFNVSVLNTGEKAMAEINVVQPDLIILDWMLPGMSGLEICRELRKISRLPVIMLTARSEEVDKLLGLELGADDYITKPFSLRELVARIKAVLRRTQPENNSIEQCNDTIICGDITINLERYQVYRGEDEISLTPTEYKLLLQLAQNPGRVYSRLQLLNVAMGEEYANYERSIDTHIRNLRRKIEQDPGNPSYILTVFGIGYKFRGGP